MCATCASRLKLKHHAAEAGGVGARDATCASRLKLKHHAAEAGGVGCGCVRVMLKLKHQAAEAGGVGQKGITGGALGHKS